jgi:hypothetical protein
MRLVYRARIMTTLAGMEAEEACCGERLGVAEQDRRDALFMADDCGDIERLERLRRATRRLVIRHRDKIERVARALLRRKTLQPREVDAQLRATPSFRR